MKKYLAASLLALGFSCNSNDNNKESATVQIDQESLAEHIETLASDDFMGRMPFTEGEEKTVNYLRDEFSKLGVSPGNDGSFFQEVPLVEINGTASETMKISGEGEDFELEFFEEFVALTLKPEEQVSLEDSELVFAGYGIVAPEYDWNDYEGVDWEGKTAVVLVNDPGFATGDSTLFKGNEMTYYGRWTYKYEEAARQGAAGVIIIHETEPASYGWNVVQSGWTGPQLNLESDAPVADVQGWVSQGAAEKLFEASSIENKNYNELALSEDFEATPMGINATVSITNEIDRNTSKNVIAVVEGSERKDEFIFYTAHWDHLGIGRPVDGDSIYNGAVDNATGTAALISIAEAFKKGEQPERSIAFIAVTAEEQGLLGSAYYAENPIFSPEKTVAVINIDALQSPGKMKDLTITGYGHSEMDEYAKEAAQRHDRYIIADPEAEKGFFYRSDHFNFAKIGIPALYASGSYEGFDMSAEEVKELNDDYSANKYHQPSDEYDPETTELSGVREDLQLFYEIGLKLANEDYFPKWYEGSEFKAAREDN
ncbi:M28 family metallopeptidase [Salegentibacter sp.]|uniref:M28 family metallopeptidase n=1 Tax=Salegentibacter sp. TaxID=1903072 RepID=UPI0035625214